MYAVCLADIKTQITIPYTLYYIRNRIHDMSTRAEVNYLRMFNIDFCQLYTLHHLKLGPVV